MTELYDNHFDNATVQTIVTSLKFPESIETAALE
jgi:hypothetical protein